MSRMPMPFLPAMLILASVPAAAGAVTMDQLWPSEDGRSWTYEQHFESYLEVPGSQDNLVRLFFDGLAVAPTSIQAQYLHHEVLSGPLNSVQLPGGIDDSFLGQLWIARPDLRTMIDQAIAGAPCPGFAPPSPHSVLLNGEFAYLKTASEIAAWRCNLADTRSWKWLESDLSIGHEFTLQLIPDLATDVFLHGTIGAIEASSVPAGTFPNCVRVDYVVDFGLTTCTDIDGNPTGTARGETRGYIRYSPGEGPVESFEEFVPVVEVTGTCGPPENVGAVATRTTMQLGSPSVATRAATWGALKSIYR